MSDSPTFTVDAWERALKYLNEDAKRPYRIVYIGPPYEGDYPPVDWPGWIFPHREYTDMKRGDA